MIIEQKKITSTEILLFFPIPLSLIGSFYCTMHKTSSFSLIQNIAETNLATHILLTTDFLYLQSPTSKELEDLKSIALAELDDYFKNPLSQQVAPTEDTEIKAQIILKTIVVPFLQKDGGDIELKDYKDGIIFVKFLGKCHGCPYAQKTLKDKVEKTLIHYLPEIKEATLI